jgi:hypothetical protein
MKKRIRFGSSIGILCLNASLLQGAESIVLPPTHVDDLAIVTNLDAKYKNAMLKTSIRVVGQPGSRFKLTGELNGFDGKKISAPAMRQSGTIGANGAAIQYVQLYRYH